MSDERKRKFREWLSREFDQRATIYHNAVYIADKAAEIFSDPAEQMMVEANEKLAAEFRAASRSGAGKPEGTAESLLQCATMLDAYGPDCFPASEDGQIHFARAMMESTADEIRAFLAAHADQSATDIGPQKGPASVAQIQAQTKQAQREIGVPAATSQAAGSIHEATLAFVSANAGRQAEPECSDMPTCTCTWEGTRINNSGCHVHDRSTAKLAESSPATAKGLPDSDEPISEGWLREVGFTVDMRDADAPSMFLGRLRFSQQAGIWTTWLKSGIREWLTMSVIAKTRDDVRQLCRALKIPLKEKADA